MSSSLEAFKQFYAEDNTSIFYRHRAAENETARLVIAHGLGEHSGRYAHVIDRLNESNISVWAFDHRGHGQSQGKRGHVDTINQYINDLKSVVDIAKKNIPPNRKLFLLGHSMGGLMVLNFVQTYPDAVDGVIASSPGLRPGMRVPLVKGTVAKIISRIYPSLAFDNELDTSFLSHDADVVYAYENDPLVHRTITARWFTEFLKAMAITRACAEKIRIPVLMQVAGQDRLVDARTSRQFFESLTVSDKTLFFYDSLFHEIYNELGEDRQKVLADLMSWLHTHM